MSVGLTAARNPARAKLLRQNGAREVFIDGGSLAAQARERYAGGVDKVLEMIGTATLADSLRCVKERGTVCMTGMVGNAWTIADSDPMRTIPTGVCLTTYDGGPADFMATPLQEMVDRIAAGTMRVTVGRTFPLDRIVDAHRAMEANAAGGKIVVLT